jgi:hypothetical protein
MPYNIAGIDVHKRLLVVVIADAAEPEQILHSRRFGTGHTALRSGELAAGYRSERSCHEEHGAILETSLAGIRTMDEVAFGAGAVRAPRGRKSDLADAKRLLKRFVAGELFLSLVPDSGAARLAHSDARAAAVGSRAGTSAEPDREPPGGGAY